MMGLRVIQTKVMGTQMGKEMYANCESDENGCQILIKLNFLANTSVRR